MLDESSDSRHFIMAKNKGFCPAFHKSWRHHGHRLWSTGPTVFLSSADIHLKTWSSSVSIMLGISCMETRKMTLRNLVDKLLVKMQWVFIFNFCFLYATHWRISLEIHCDISDSGVWRTKKKKCFNLWILISLNPRSTYKAVGTFLSQWRTWFSPAFSRKK